MLKTLCMHDKTKRTEDLELLINAMFCNAFWSPEKWQIPDKGRASEVPVEHWTGQKGFVMHGVVERAFLQDLLSA
jgi:hypothetical protein